MARYVALLRGINVGGKRKVPMADLRDVFAELGYRDVSTYIQSGNVLFSATGAAAKLEGDIERALETTFGFPLVVVVRSERQLRAVVDKAPAAFRKDPDAYYRDAVFLKAPLTAATAMKVIERIKPREGVDEAWMGAGVVYFQRLGAERTRSKLSKVASTPEYQLMTIRSWATTTKLIALLDE
jgi:uncharacterized protein (DUF1697 family)